MRRWNERGRRWGRWSEWFDAKFGHLTNDPRHRDNLQGGALMAFLLLLMFLPQWCFKLAVRPPPNPTTT
jgi:hypothetical protein